MIKKQQPSGNAIAVGIATVIGCFVLFGSIQTFLANEKRLLQNYLTLEFVKKNYVEASADTIEADKEGKLVLIHGKSATEDVITDPVFKVKVDNCLSLYRSVEMYQWKEKEHRHTTGSGKNRRTHYSYSYDKGWYNYVIDSIRFHRRGYDNPNVMHHQPLNMVSKNIKVGAYIVTSVGFEKLGPSEDVFIDATTVDKPDSAEIQNNKIYYNTYIETKFRKQKIKDKANESNGVKNYNVVRPVVIDKPVYNEKNPKLGDVKISFKKHPVCEVTILAKQSGDKLIPYKTQYRNIYEVKYGNVSFGNILEEKQKQASFGSWGFRVFSIFAMIFGVLMASSCTKKIGCLLCLTIPLAITTGIISFVWLPYRVVFGLKSLILFVIAFVVSILLFLKNSLTNQSSDKNSFRNNNFYGSRSNSFNNSQGNSFYNRNDNNSGSILDRSNNYRLSNNYDNKYNDDEYK